MSTDRRAVFLYGPQLWKHGHGPGHPLKPERLRRTFELLSEYGAFDAPNVRLVEPRRASDEELAYFHTPEYIGVVRALSAGETDLPGRQYGFGPGDNPVFEGMYETESLKAGSALAAAEMLVQDECGVAFSFSGGLHHGAPAMASGFCVFDDIAVAVHWLLRQGLRVAYVDIDVHHGDGVQAAFYDTDRVLTVSLHQDGRTLFPGTGFVSESGVGAGAGYSVNVPLPPYTDDEAYLWAFNQVVPPLIERFQPDIVATQLGVDTHFEDPLARLALTTRGHLALFEALAALAGRPERRWLAFGGGGYNLDVVPRSWTLAFGVMSGQAFPDELPPGYRARYGGRWLRDRGGPDTRLTDHTRMRRAVEAVVRDVQERHGLIELVGSRRDTMEEVLVVLAHDKPTAARSAQKRVEAGGGHIRQRYGPDVLIVEAGQDLIEVLTSDQGVAGVYTGEVTGDFTRRLDETGQLGIAAWNQRHSAAFQQAKQDRQGEGLDWDHPDYDREGRQDP